MFVFVETTLFTKRVSQYLSEDEYARFQAWLLENPEAGDLIAGSGGLRKARWARKDTGKRGGVRIIYFLRRRKDTIWLITLYSKNEAASIPTHVLRRIAKEIEDVDDQT